MSAQNSRNIVLIPAQTLTASGTSGIIVVPEGFTRAIFWLTTGTPAGTTETLDVYVQHALRGVTASADATAGLDLVASTYTLFDDFLHFTQITTSTATIVAKYSDYVTAAAVVVNKDAALAAATFSAGPLGAAWRIKWVITGTSPSYPSTYLVAQLLP